MMKIKHLAFLMISSTLLIACGSKSEYNMKQEELFPKGERLPKEWFSGEAILNPLVAKDKNNDFSAGSVTFEPGARTNWHTHPKGQVLIVTEGEGLYQEKGKSVQVIAKGSVVNIPENVEHWHGASSKSKMVHIAITNFKGDTQVTWMNPVTDEEYDAVNKQ